MRILFGMERRFTTLLQVAEDSRDQECLVTNFELVRSVSVWLVHGWWWRWRRAPSRFASVHPKERTA
jgi:hypothetical protein